MIMVQWVTLDPLEKEMATHCSILAWEIPCTEEPTVLGVTKSQTQLSNRARMQSDIGWFLRNNRHKKKNTASTRFSWDTCLCNLDTVLWGSPGHPAERPIRRETGRLHPTASHVNKPSWKWVIQNSWATPTRRSRDEMVLLSTDQVEDSWIK